MTTAYDLEERTYFSSIEDAIGDWQPPLDNITAIREAVNGLRYEHVHIPASRAYIALEGAPEEGIVGYVMPGFVSLQPADGPASVVPLPVDGLPAPTKAKSSTRSTAKDPEPAPEVCPQCFTVLPLAKVCQFCE